MKTPPEIHRLDWNGVLLEITYTPWLPAHIVGEDLAHLTVRCLYPRDAALPIGRNGYYAHTLPASSVLAAGGPAAYVDVMLATEGGAP